MGDYVREHYRGETKGILGVQTIAHMNKNGSYSAGKSNGREHGK